MSTLEVPISDNYVQMNRLVTDLSRNTDSINNIEIGVTKLTDIYGNQYVIKGFEQNTVTGFFGAILQNTSSLETTAVVAGSYGLMNFTHPAWYPDWVGNNAVVGFDGIPPQFYDTVGLLNNYRHLGIDSATGFSLGAIDLGLALSLTDNYGIQGYFYNGGPPLGLLDNLANSGFSLNLSRDNYADRRPKFRAS